MNVEFLPDEWYDHHRRKIVWFKAILDEKTIDCGVSMEALADHFGAYYDDPLPTFRAHREAVQRVTEQLIERRRFEDDGTVIVRSADIKSTGARAASEPSDSEQGTS